MQTVTRQHVVYTLSIPGLGGVASLYLYHIVVYFYCISLYCTAQ